MLATFHYLVKGVVISRRKTPMKVTPLTHFHWADYHQRERGASSKSVKYFTTMTCLAGFLNAIAAWTKSLSEKAAKTPASTVHWKSWIEAWNPNPTFSRWGQKLFQSIFLLTKLEIEAFCQKKTWLRWNIDCERADFTVGKNVLSFWNIN